MEFQEGVRAPIAPVASPRAPVQVALCEGHHHSAPQVEEAPGQRFTGPEDAPGRCWTVAFGVLKESEPRGCERAACPRSLEVPSLLMALKMDEREEEKEQVQ